MSKLRILRRMSLVLVCALSLSAQQAPLAPDLRALLDHVSADSLRGHLSFIASDALEGRDSPSRGLDIAAEYIAAQFRRSGLEPAGGDGYFQTANWRVAEQNLRTFRLQLTFNGQTLDVGPQHVSFRIGSAVE